MAQVKLTTPISEDSVRSLKAGDEVLISGILYTGRDAVHKHLAGGGELHPDVDLSGGILYHCGPVVVEKGGANGERTFTVTAAGPTTSIREEPYQADIIARFGVRGVIGKGGMGLKTLAACKESGAVYLHAVGGAAQVYADCIKGVEGVYLEEFGSPEAVWVLRVEDFPAIVTMDAHGNSLHEEVQGASLNQLKAALG
jgi:tartrate/fumarate subfamily iron-sulfur-dependent hydro-lyase beta chain